MARWGVAAVLGALWWWALARLVLAPGAGVLEAAVVAGGWGLSLLPVHCVPKGQAEGALAAGRWRRAWRAVTRSRGGAQGEGRRWFGLHP
ncbi:hypothetical protein [Streptomyces thermospinosisporus]